MKVKTIAWSLGIGGLITASLTGLVYVANLPYPMIRRPVAKVAPLLLLPSYIELDRNYREAIAHVQQADQLVNHPSSFADITLGEQEVKLAQTKLDALPVWFLGDDSLFYCQHFSCSWHFTLNEIEQARSDIGRMQAVVFQQKNAIDQYQKAETNLAKVKQDYQQAVNSQQQQIILTQWQHSLDEMKELPSSTFAETVASAKLEAYEREFEQVTGNIAGNEQKNLLIQAAKEFTSSANIRCQKPPHVVEQWEQCSELWQQAISRLDDISPKDPGYLETQTLLAQYQTNLGIIEMRTKAEKASVEAFEEAKQKIQELQVSFAKGINADERKLFISELQVTIEQLKQVQPGTTVYEEAQRLLQLAQVKLKEAFSST